MSIKIDSIEIPQTVESRAKQKVRHEIRRARSFSKAYDVIGKITRDGLWAKLAEC